MKNKLEGIITTEEVEKLEELLKQAGLTEEQTASILKESVVSKATEPVLVVDSTLVHQVFKDYKDHTGVELNPSENVNDFVETLEKNPNELKVHQRGLAEVDPSIKQLIPYTIIRNGEGKIMVYKRESGGGEGRLHDKYSIGVGGHSNPITKEELGLTREPTFLEMMAENGNRELEEELTISGEKEVTTLGLLNDDTNEVGQVHVCYLQECKVTGEVSVSEEEQDILKIVGWYTEEELQAMVKEHNFETWSELIINEFK